MTWPTFFSHPDRHETETVAQVIPLRPTFVAPPKLRVVPDPFEVESRYDECLPCAAGDCGYCEAHGCPCSHEGGAA